ncbi:MAG: transcription elongation factor Spt5 [Candidatus Thorarchaeota archaeon]|nr:transcription elongation factor Spt5 [Candidatus Thorarchaeota archaeon]
MRGKTSIYAIRTTIGQERSVTDLVTTAVIGESDVWQCPYCAEQFSSENSTLRHMEKCEKKKKSGEPILVSRNQLLGRVKSILVPETLRGYVFIETEEFRDVEIAISGVPHVRGRVGGKVSLDEIDKFLTPKPAAEGISTGDVVEIISGPFKGERAKVVRVESAKEELVLELLDSPVTIPIRVHADFVKLVEKGKELLEPTTEEPTPTPVSTPQGGRQEEGEKREEEEEEEDSFWSQG